jgi:DNA-binding transcriptional LysR family regulator
MQPINKLDLNLLKAFVVLMDECNVSRAAERLSLTQPAVTGILNRLRTSLDDPLFIRAQHGMIPTERAKELAVPIRRLLDELNLVLQPEVFDPKTAELTIHLAGTDYSLSSIIVPFIEKLRVKAPNIRVAARFIQDDLVSQQMEQGQLDIALMTPETAPEGLRGRTLFEEEYVCIVSKQHPLAQQKTLTMDQFCEADHALVSYLGGAFEGATDAALAKLGRKRRVMTSVPSFLVLVALLKNSPLMAVVPKRLTLGAQGITTLTLPFNVPGFTKYMVWHERTHAHPAYQWIREQLQECSLSR